MSILRVDNPPNPWTGNRELEWLEEPPKAELEVFEERARSILSRNDSPDLPFRYGLNPYRGCFHACSYCLDGETRILMADGTTKPLADLRVGEAIVGTERRGRYRRYVETTVLDHWRTLEPAYRVRLDDGTELVASGDHRFLTERGWKHVVGAMSGVAQRPYLTLNNRLLGPGAGGPPPAMREDYRRGYLCGMIRGDAHLAVHDYSGARRGRDVQYHFRLALVDGEALARTASYLRDFSVETRSFAFHAGVSSRKLMSAIRSSSRAAYVRISELVGWPEFPSDEWVKGFLAGIFDAEGSYSRGIVRIANNDEAILNATLSAFTRLGFDACLEPRGENAGAASVRLRGGLEAHQRFFQSVSPAISRKTRIAGHAVKNSACRRVAAIEPLGVARPLYDITTGTGDFVANGVISHNCYARPTHQYLGFGAGSDFDHRIVVKINAPELLRETFLKRSWTGEAIVLSGVTDCYQPLEASYRLTRGCLEVCRDFRNPVGIITKSALVRRDVDLLADLARRASARVYVSIPFADDAVGRAIEPGASAIRQRFVTLRVLAEAGVPCGVAVAPVIPGLGDSDIPEILERAAEAGADRAFMQLLRLPDATREVFEKRIADAFPERAAKILRALEEMRGGERANHHRFGERMRGHGPRWQTTKMLFEVHARRLGLVADTREDAATAMPEAERPTPFRRPGSQGTLSFDE